MDHNDIELEGVILKVENQPPKKEGASLESIAQESLKPSSSYSRPIGQKKARAIKIDRS